MALQVWLPLDGSLRNNGLLDVIVTNHGATVENNGKIGKCYAFDNNTSYIALQHINLYSILNGATQPFSVCFWVYQADASRAIIFGDFSVSGGNNFNIELTTGHTLRWYWGTPDFSISAMNVGQGVWAHVAFTYDGTTLKGYINGQLKYTGTYTLAAKGRTTGEYYLGRDGRTGTTTLNGRLNDFRIYNHCLSSKEVKEISKGLILHYPLDSQQINPVNNLVIGVTAGGQTTKLTDGRVGVMTSGTNADTYFTINLSENIVKDTKYTLICYAEGISVGAYWGFPLGMQNNSTLPFKIYNGYNEYTFIANDINWGNLRLFMDDNGRADWVNRATFWGFQLYKNPSFQIFDSSGYGHHGTMYNDITLENSSARNIKATHFNATNQYIRVTGLQTTGFSNSYSFAWWGKCSSFGNNMHWGFSDGVRLNGMYYGNLWNTGDSSSNPLYQPGTTTQVAAPTGNVWHHYVMTGDGTKCRVYKDGVLWAEAKTYKTITGTILVFNGWDTGTSYSYSDLSLSDFRIYSTALSADDAKELYNTTAFIDNKQNFSAYELIEDDNAEVRKTGVLEGVSFYESGTDALHYDTQIYTEPDGSKWAHISHHNNPAGGVFPSNSKWNLGVYVDANRWYDVEQIIAISDKYEFMVKQKPTSDGTEVKYRWIQTVSPLTATWNDVKPGTVTNITTSGYTNGGNGGMYIANNNTHICIANSSNGNWFGGIGTYTAYQGGIPGYPNTTITTGYEDLYIRIYPEVQIYNSGQIKSNTFYEI